MDITYRIDKNILYIAVEGRVDASNAAEAEKKIFEIKNANADKHVVLDAENLEYVSSAGLRILLTTQKTMSKQGKMVVRHVNKSIAEVFRITGFSKVLTVE